MDGGDEPEADTFLGVEVPDDPAAPPPGGGEDDANGGGDSAMDGGGDEDAMGDTDGDGDGDGDAEGQDGPDDADLDLDNLGVDDTPPVRDDAIHVCTVHSGPVYAVAAVGPIVATGSGDDTGALLTPDASLADAAAVAAAGTPPPLARSSHSRTRPASASRSPRRPCRPTAATRRTAPRAGWWRCGRPARPTARAG